MAPFIINTNIPAATANGWVHVVIPINLTTANLDGCSGFVFHKWVSQYNGQIANDFHGRFWIDNVILQGTAGPPPPPIVKVPTKATRGLNVFANTQGNYDREEAVLRQETGLGWVGVATPSSPVTYSFTIAGFPHSENGEAYLFLNPNPNYLDNAPDWNETNSVVIYVQGDPNNATMHFQYKVGDPGDNAMLGGGGAYTNAPGSWNGSTPGYKESGNLGSVNNNSIFGTWTVKFTSDSNVTLIAPDGNSTNLTIPSYNTPLFAENDGSAIPFTVYLGMQANNADAQNQAVVYANFAITGNAQPFSENFLTDTALDTTNIWNTGPTTSPQGVFIVNNSAASWVSWTLPDTGFSLQVAPTLNNPLGWTTPTTGPIVPMNGIRAQLLASNEIPAGNTAFFQLIKRQFTQLQVLFPGETNAPNTLTGKIGSPTSFNAYDEVDVTINAVDSTYHIVNSTDVLNIGASDTTATITTPTPALAGGAVIVPIYFGTSGSWTVTATDTTSTNIPVATSSSITIH
jgi:hypothetical protein